MKKENVTLHNIKIDRNGDSQAVNVDLKWIDKPETLYGSIMITFTDVRDEAETICPKKQQESFTHHQAKGVGGRTAAYA